MSRPVWQRAAVLVAAILVVVVVATAVIGVGLVRRAFPEVSGTIEVPGLAGEVEIVRDAQGIPHIYADTPEDLFRAQGFVAAQDRFFQMDLRRHVTAGRLSELVGPGGLETDKVIRTMGWRRVAEQELPGLSPSARNYLQAYAAGVNAYIESRGGPSSMGLEYLALSTSAPGYQVEPWTEIDSLAWLKAMAWDLRGNYTDELTRGLLVGHVPLPQLGSLYPDYPVDEHAPILDPQEWQPRRQAPVRENRGGSAGPVAPEPPEGEPGPPQPPVSSPEHVWLADAGVDEALTSTALALGAVPEMMGRGEGIGSNSWVVSGDHTASGRPLLANDPHLGVTQPSVWLQAGLHCRVVSDSCPFDVSGFTFAGFPGVIIGHNQNIAWGFTNMDPDVTDFYLEDVEEDRVLRGEEYVPMDVREETLKVAGGDDVTIRVRSTSHGPIVSDVIDSMADLGRNAPLDGVQTSNRYEVALAWTGLVPARTAEAVFTLNAAQGWDDFRDAARLFAVPAQNLVYADTDGNIGYQAPGLVPIRGSATHGTPPGFYPAPGWEQEYAWDGWVDFAELPYVLNPDDGIIVAANQAVVRGQRPFLSTEFDKGYRSDRIEVLLQQELAAGKLTVQTMQRMQLDDRNAFAETLVPYLLDADLEGTFYTEAQDLLRTWDFTAPAEGEHAAAAAYFYATYANLLETTFDDELPPELGATGGSRWMLLLEQLLSTPDSPWWDDRRTVGVVESRDEVIRAALIQARLDLTSDVSKHTSDWSWGELHQLRLEHEVLSGDEVPALVRRMFNQPPTPVAGSTSVVNAMNWDASTGSFEVTSAPSMRMVVDLADLDASTWINHTGTSGHPFHPHWSDQTETWIEGGTYPWPFTREAVVDAGQDTLVLEPAPGNGR